MILTTAPVVPLQPVCRDANDTLLFSSVGEVRGTMSDEFQAAYAEKLSAYRVRFVRIGDGIFVTAPAWLDRDLMAMASDRTVSDILARRKEGDPTRKDGGRIGYPDFDRAHPSVWPPCSAMRKLALRGGAWADGREVSPSP